MLLKLILQGFAGWVLVQGLMDPSTSGMLQELVQRNMAVAYLLIERALA